MSRSALCLLLLVAAASLLVAGVAGMSLFGPPTFSADDNGKTVTVNSGDTFWLKLPENPTTGYAWDLQLSDGLSKLSDRYESADRSGLKVGVGGTHYYEIKAMSNGSQRILGNYRQAANQSSESRENYTLNVNVADGGPLAGLLRMPLPLLAGSVCKWLIPTDDFTGFLSPAITVPTFPIIKTGTSGPPLPAARNDNTPQEIPLSYTDVPTSDAVDANIGDSIVLSLPENPSTGYSWQMTVSDGITQVSDNYVQGGSQLARPLVGAGGTHTWTFKVTKPGTQTISGVSKRPWESSSQGEKRYTLDVKIA